MLRGLLAQGRRCTWTALEGQARTASSNSSVSAAISCTAPSCTAAPSTLLEAAPSHVKWPSSSFLASSPAVAAGSSSTQPCSQSLLPRHPCSMRSPSAQQHRSLQLTPPPQPDCQASAATQTGPTFFSSRPTHLRSSLSLLSTRSCSQPPLGGWIDCKFASEETARPYRNAESTTRLPEQTRTMQSLQPRHMGLSLLQLTARCGSLPMQLPPMQLGLVRSFAKKAAPPPVKATAVVTRKRRRSSTRLFSVRNDRFRSAFEQVWPTLRLTTDEQKMLRRNNGMFVVEMGKSVKLKAKFNMNKVGGRSVGHASVSSMLHEQDLHIDGVGEHPRYLRLRRLRTQFGVQLQNLRKVRVLMGFKRRKFVQKMYESCLVQPGPNKAWKLVASMESKLQFTALRMGFAEDILVADTMLRKGNLLLNGTLSPSRNAYFAQPADVIAPAPHKMRIVQQYVARQMAPLMRNVYQSFM